MELHDIFISSVTDVPSYRLSNLWHLPYYCNYAVVSESIIIILKLPVCDYVFRSNQPS